MESLDLVAGRVRHAVALASRSLVDRQVLVELVALALVAREHLLVVGPPGTAKSQAVRRIAQQFRGSYFEYLLGRFTEPTDIFGSVDLAKLRQGQVEIQTAGMLPEAEIAFLDEVFLGSTAILNTLLALLNERVFTRGHTRLASPLRVCVGASNSIPTEPALEAFADRFLVRVFVESLPDEMLETLLEAGWTVNGESAPKTSSVASSIADLEVLASHAAALDLTPIRPRLAEAIRLLRQAGISLSDRRVVKTQRLVAAATVLRSSLAPTGADLWPVVFAVPSAEQQTLAREVLRDLLADSVNSGLNAAAEDASLAPAARAHRLSGTIRELLGNPPASDWSARAEATLREVDASFDDVSIPADLKLGREALARRFEETS